MVAVCALQVVLTLTHVPWRDEWHAFQIAAHSPSIADLFANLRYEGHPALWYLLLRAISSVSDSPYALVSLQAAIAVGSLAILFLRSPFKPWVNVLTGLGYLILFEYGTIARSYGLGVLLLLAFLSLRGTLLGWIALALMANISVHFLLLSMAAAALLLVVEKRWTIAGLSLWLLGCALAVWVMIPASDLVAAVESPPTILGRLGLTLESASRIVVPFVPGLFPVRWEPDGLNFPWDLLLAALIPVIGWTALRQDWRAGLIFLGLSAAITALSIFVYPAATRHFGVLFLFVIAAEWVLVERDGGSPSAVSKLWIGSAAMFGMLMAASALSHPFTSGRQIASWVRHQGLETAIWAVYPSWEGVALGAELGRPFYDINRQCLGHFHYWNAAAKVRYSAAEMSALLAEAAQAAGGRLYLVAERGSLPKGVAGLTPIGSFQPGLQGEVKDVFQLESAGPQKALTPCP